MEVSVNLEENKNKSAHATKLSAMVILLIESAEKNEITLKTVFTVMGKRGTATLIFFFAFVIFQPIALFPGFAAILAIIILILSFNLIIERDKPWLPKQLLAINLSAGAVTTGLKRSVPFIHWLERHTGRRLVWIAEGRLSDQVAGVVISIHAILLIAIGFIPLAGFITIPVMFLSTGLFVRDGVIYLLGYLLSILTFGILAYLGFFVFSYFR